MSTDQDARSASVTAERGDPVVVSGIGCITPSGVGISALWGRLGGDADRDTTDDHERFEQVGRVPNELLDISSICVNKHVSRLRRRSVYLSLRAVADALASAALSLDEADRTRVGIFVVKRDRRFYDLEPYREAMADLIKQKQESPDATRGNSFRTLTRVYTAIDVLNALPGVEAFAVGIAFRILGPALTFVSAEVGALQTIEAACTRLRSGDIDHALIVAAQDELDVLEQHRDSRLIDGRTQSEASVALCLERSSTAEARGANPYGRIDQVHTFASGRCRTCAIPRYPRDIFPHSRVGTGWATWLGTDRGLDWLEKETAHAPGR